MLFRVPLLDAASRIARLPAPRLRHLGVDHKCMTFPHEGRGYRLSDVCGDIVKVRLA
jgi:hypothetical protein